MKLLRFGSNMRYLQLMILTTISQKAISKLCDEFKNTNISSTITSLRLNGRSENSGNCSWLLDNGNNSLKILLTIKYNIVCGESTINVRDGSDISSTSLGTFCGHSTAIISSTDRYIFIMLSWTTSSNITLVSEIIATGDYSGNGCVRKETIVVSDDKDHFISSPGFPAKYPSSISCRWVLTNYAGYIQVDILFSDIEDDTSLRCDYDVYTIHDGEFRCENNLVIRACSEFQKFSPSSFTSNGSSVVVIFESDSSVNNRGFLLRYKAIRRFKTSTSQYRCSSQSVENSGFETSALAGIVLGSVLLICFTTMTVIFLVFKGRPSFHKVPITPLKEVMTVKFDNTDTLRARRPELFLNMKFRQDSNI